MAVPRLYPLAIHKMDGSGVGEWSGRGAWKVVIHTTETRGMPRYSDGALAPHLTFWPARGTVTQHSTLRRPSESVRAFDDDQIYQIEVICYSAHSVADRVGGLRVGDLTVDHLRPIATFVEWLVGKGVPVQTVWPGKRALSSSQANAAGFRMTSSEFFQWPGLLGHQHTPAPNTHWDPGAFPWEKLIDLLGGPDMAEHPASSYGRFIDGHDIGEVPSWSPWEEYVAAGGSSIKTSGTWAFTRADIAWVWSKFIDPLRKRTIIQATEIAALDRSIDALEAANVALARRVVALESAPPGSIEIETEKVEVVKGVRIVT